MKECIAMQEEIVNLDPFKRVNYVHGLVLGVDEFLQEELYLLRKHRDRNRLLHGYGTVCGLKVSVDDTATQGPRLKVRKGVAVDPQGREVRVPAENCAFLNNWLDRNRERVEEALGSPPSGPLSLFLTLTYQECKTDAVPLPSGPCQSFEETTAASRVADNYSLALDLEAPAQEEEQAVRELIDLLSKIRITDSAPQLTLQNIHDIVLSTINTDSPPAAPAEPWNLDPANAKEFLRAALRVWITDVRPYIIADATGDDRNCLTGPAEETVLLARLHFDVKSTELGLSVDGTAADVEIDERERPYLLQSRMLQEWMLCMSGKLE